MFSQIDVIIIRGEGIELNVQLRSGAVGDFYILAISEPRPEINQPQEIWQLRADFSWQKLVSLQGLNPLLSLDTPFALTASIARIAAGRAPFDKEDTDYNIYSLVVAPGEDLFSGNWITPLASFPLTANKSFSTMIVKILRNIFTCKGKKMLFVNYICREFCHLSFSETREGVRPAVAGKPGSPNVWWEYLKTIANKEIFSTLNADSRKACAEIREAYRPVLKHYDIQADHFFWGSIKKSRS